MHNADYQHGLLSSVICGARAVKSEYCFITHGDLPCIRAEVFRTLWPLRYNGSILPYYQGIPGHPILVARRYLQQRLNHSDGSSVRQALLSGRHQRLELEYPEIILILIPLPILFACKIARVARSDALASHERV